MGTRPPSRAITSSTSSGRSQRFDRIHAEGGELRTAILGLAKVKRQLFTQRQNSSRTNRSESSSQSGIPTMLIVVEVPAIERGGGSSVLTELGARRTVFAYNGSRYACLCDWFFRLVRPD